MENLIINGVNASGTISGLPNMYTQIRSIQIDMPLADVSTSNVSLTVSGSSNGAHTFHQDTTLELNYGYNEDINITTTNFSGDYSAIINYINVGDQMGGYVYDRTRPNMSNIKLPSRFIGN